MFKNIFVYSISPAWVVTLEAMQAALEGDRYVPCGASQETSAGWIEPRGIDHAPLIESVAGQWIFKFMKETKILPGSVVKEKVKEKAEEIERATGRKPGKKELRELKDDTRLSLLPMAFTKKSATVVWIDPAKRLLVIDAASHSKVDEVITFLVKAFEGFSVSLLQTQQSAMSCMAHWLTSQEPPNGFSIDRECALSASDESKAGVRYSRHPLDIEEIKGHIALGKIPKHLAMTWNDRVSFTLTDAGVVKKIVFLDTVFEGASSKDGKDDMFDADVAISTGELSKLIENLGDALGGYAPLWTELA